MAALCERYLLPHSTAPLFKEVIEMLIWLSANWINIVLAAALVLIVGLLLRGMIRDKKAGKPSCGGNCASCGACSGCPEGLASRRSACARCGSMSSAATDAKGRNRTI